MTFDLRLAQSCAEAFSDASSLGCVLADKEGKLLFSAGNGCDKCGLCKKLGRGEEYCREATLYGMRESERFGGKYVYFCALGLTCFASPILGKDGTAACLTVGPFRMVEEQDDLYFEWNDSEQFDTETAAAVSEIIREFPYVEPRRVKALSELLFMSVSFLNSASDAARLMEKEQSDYLQGRISDSIYQIKQSDEAAPYPYREEKRFLQAFSRGDQEQTQELLNRLLGYIMFESGGQFAQIQNRVHELLILLSRTLIESGADSAFAEYCIQQSRNEIFAAGNVEDLCLRLSKMVRSLLDAQFSHRKARHSDLIYRTIQFLHAGFSRKLSLEEVARNVYISPTYLSRIFKAEVGCSLVDYLNRIRVEKSRNLLADPNVRLIEVAFQCGFESQSYFNRVFKQACGVTPQQYRKEALQKETASISNFLNLKANSDRMSNEYE